jgi:carbamoyltransferase
MITVGIYGIDDIKTNAFSTYTHDHAITVMKNGKVTDMIALERITGAKHDQRLGIYITDLLDQFIPVGEDVRFVSVNSFLGSSFISQDGKFRIEPLETPTIQQIITPAQVKWYRNGKLCNYVGWIMCHEFAHIASALPFGVNFNEKQLLIHIDGGAFDSAASFWHIKNGLPKLLDASWDNLKVQTNNYNVGILGRTILGLDITQHLSMPGKLMGYSAFGKVDNILLRHLQKKSFYLDNNYEINDIEKDIKKTLNNNFNINDLNDPISKNIASCIQEDFEEKIVYHISKYKEQIGAKQLIYTGGAALNIPTNSRLENIFGVGNVFIPPCTSDSGLSLGAAAWIEQCFGNKIITHSPFLNNYKVEEHISLDNVQEIATAIKGGKIVALFQGASEIGPRALGHRSIIARPDRIDLKIKISEEIKKREWYRPIAPSIMDKVAKKILGDKILNSRLAPFMLGSYQLLDTYHDKFSGVLHVNNSLRPQIVYNLPENNLLYKILLQLYDDYHIYGVINTSLNIQGKPIMHFPKEAKLIKENLEGIDMVVINGSIY